MSKSNNKIDLKAAESVAKPIFNIKSHVVIDADSLIYRAAHLGEKAQKEVEIAEDHPLWKEGLLLPLHQEQASILHSMIDSILHNIEEGLNQRGATVDKYSLVFTPKADYCKANGLKLNFRYEIVDDFNRDSDFVEMVPGYKASRKGMQLPEGIPELYEYCMKLPETLVSDHSEADDKVVQMKRLDPNVTLAVIDKDIYSGCAGTHWNYNRNEWVETSVEDAELFFMRQCMTGDSSDGIKGIFRFGPKAAEKILPEWLPMDEMWSIVVNTFEEKGYPEDYAVLMYRLVSLNQLRDDGSLQLWHPIEMSPCYGCKYLNGVNPDSKTCLHCEDFNMYEGT